ncbi:hypothetical protein V8J82_14205 [Gymnodinialimonas sp. 2305UL16-5]|uniref:hypothetical protein n=1 Tax=Gymnodinialimonas mytili TaxID=3126503 RepID=UPI0030ADC80A
MQDLMLKTLLAEKRARELGFEHTATVLQKQADKLMYIHRKGSPEAPNAANCHGSPSIVAKIMAAQSKF